MVCADRSNHLEIPRTTYAGHLGPEGFRYLHRERTHAARSAVDQDLLPGPNLSFVAKALQRRDCRHRDRSGLFKGHVGGFQRHPSIRQGAHVLSQGAISPAEHLIAGFELSYVFANCFNCPRIIDT